MSCTVLMLRRESTREERAVIFSRIKNARCVPGGGKPASIHLGYEFRLLMYTWQGGSRRRKKELNKGDEKKMCLYLSDFLVPLKTRSKQDQSVPHAVCKYEFRQNPRSHSSCRFFNFGPYKIAAWVGGGGTFTYLFKYQVPGCCVWRGGVGLGRGRFGVVVNYFCFGGRQIDLVVHGIERV